MALNKQLSEIGKTRTVSWTETREITVCYHDCMKCGKKTPVPTTEQMLEFAQWSGKQHDYMWPDRHKPGCHPVAWSWYESQHYHGWLCFDCTSAVNQLIGSKHV